MNARMRVAGGTAAGGVVAGLHAWIDGHDPHVQAAVWLLLAHEVWPRRGEFVRACVNRSSDGQWWIDFTTARTAYEHGEFDHASTTELAVLDLAIALGTDRFRFRAMGPGNARAVATAVAHAVGGRPMTGGWEPGSRDSWDANSWVDDPWTNDMPAQDPWADGPTHDGHSRLVGSPAPVVVLAASGGAVAATALGLVVLLLGGAVVALIVGAMVLLGACAVGSAYLRGAR